MSLTGNPIDDPAFIHPPKDPLLLLQKWLERADKLGINEPRGFVLSTINHSGMPSSRVVLLKACDEKGVIFATSEESAKGKDLESDPRCAGTLWWREIIQQVNFAGRAIKLSEEISDKIFHERTREAQAVAAISKQSAPLRDEKEFKDKLLSLVNAKSKIERPKGWHAYHLIIESIEFWQESKDRVHKRLRYNLVNGLWSYQKLQP